MVSYNAKNKPKNLDETKELENLVPTNYWNKI